MEKKSSFCGKIKTYRFFIEKKYPAVFELGTCRSETEAIRVDTVLQRYAFKQYLNEIKVQCCDVNFKNKIELFISLDFNFLLQQVLNLFKFHSIQCIKNPILYFISIRALFYFS